MIRHFLIHAIRDHGLLELYEKFVVTRSDHFYLCQHMFSTCVINHREVIVPDGEGYDGVTDRHLIASRDTLIDALDLITPLITDTYEFDFEKHHNSERFMLSTWKDKQLLVRTGTRSMFTCATKNDTTRWQLAEEELPGVPGLFVKYPKEHKSALDGCKRFNLNSRPHMTGTCLKCGCRRKKKRRRETTFN